MITNEEKIRVFTVYERIAHWYLALTVFLLLITGLVMMYHSFHFVSTFFGGMTGIKNVHNYAGVALIPAIMMAAVAWWCEGLFDFSTDIEWFKKAGGYLWNVDDVPKSGKFNPGQKLYFFVIIFFGALMAVTGISMWWLPENPGRIPLGWMYTLHAFGVVVILSFMAVHIYLGTIGVPGSKDIVFGGHVHRYWCLHHCPKWMQRSTAGKTGK